MFDKEERKLRDIWQKLDESFGSEMPILDPANENPMVKYNRAIRDWKVWVAGHPNEVPPPRPKRPAKVGSSQPKMGWKRGGQAVWNRLHEGYKELGESMIEAGGEQPIAPTSPVTEFPFYTDPKTLKIEDVTILDENEDFEVPEEPSRDSPGTPGYYVETKDLNVVFSAELIDAYGQGRVPDLTDKAVLIGYQKSLNPSMTDDILEGIMPVVLDNFSGYEVDTIQKYVKKYPQEMWGKKAVSDIKILGVEGNRVKVSFNTSISTDEAPEADGEPPDYSDYSYDGSFDENKKRLTKANMNKAKVFKEAVKLLKEAEGMLGQFPKFASAEPPQIGPGETWTAPPEHNLANKKYFAERRATMDLINKLGGKLGQGTESRPILDLGTLIEVLQATIKEAMAAHQSITGLK